MNSKGITLIELLITVAIVGLLAMIAIPGYLGQQKRAARTEAYTNLENLRLLEEQFYAENGRYTVSLGTCAKDNPGNITQIQQGGAALDPANDLPGFRPGPNTMYSYCIEQDETMDGTGLSGCFAARAFGNTGTRVDLDQFDVDCRNNRNF
ncbi:MAG: prepilin-type N-terminal cleavage/methylation domain-containing protein [Nitrospirae bacterium]|nr:prepilin-type N-terminal cleavage/methylation domain-containing protein [Nitrospirota bacterium]